MDKAARSADARSEPADLPVLGVHIMRERALGALSDFGLPFLLASCSDQALRSRGNVAMGTPPYANILCHLGLFDPIELPWTERGPQRSTFPVVVHSARTLAPQGHHGRLEREPSLADVMARDGSRIISSVGDVFEETTRWAVSNVFGQLREAMDYIESKAHLDQPKPNNDQRETLTESLIAPSLLHALQRDLSTSLDNLVPEPTEEEKAGCRSYQVSARTMADGSIETRKVLCANDGTTTTTVTRHHPDSQKEDGVTVFQHK